MLSNTSMPNFPGAAEIESVMHYNGTEEHDITGIVKGLNISADVNITSSFCEIAVYDYSNWMEKIQMGAGDAVKVVIKYENESYERRYRIRSFDSVENLEKGKRYIIMGISDLEYLSIHKKISRSYNGLPSDIAVEVFKNSTNEELFTLEQSSQNISFIAPVWSPMKILNYLAKRSSTSDGLSRMEFFQDTFQRWHFTSMKNLFQNTQNEVITYRYNANTLAQNGIPNTEAMITSIMNIRFLSTFDIMKETNKGNIKNTLVDIDLDTKSLSMVSNSYWDSFNKTVINPTNQWKPEEFGIGNYQTRVFPSLHNKHLSSVYDSRTEGFDFPKGQVMEIVTFGNPFIDIGDMVNIEIPSMEPLTSNKKEVLDNVWSGIYYVIAKTDVFDESGHGMALRVSKDSLREEI